MFNKKSNQINVSHNNDIIRRINVNQTDNINSNNLEKNEQKQSFIDKFTSKSLSCDDTNNFNFKTASWTLTIIYLISFIIIPILYSLIKTYAVKDTSQSSFLSLFIFSLLPIFGLVVSLGIDWETMIKKGGWAAYSHSVFGFISVVFVLLFFIATKVISGKNDDVTSLATTFLIQQLFQLLGSILVLIFCRSLLERIITTLKEAKLDLITWVTIFAVIGSVLNVIFNIIPNFSQFNMLTNNNTSKNQDVLNLLMNSPYGIFVLVLSTIFIAPINEEISYRHGTFTIVRYRWLAYVASLIYFPSMHVMNSGDWNNIIGYLGFSIILPLLFIMTGGNTTYTIGLHAFSNLIATISGFINKN
ncbi:type II CAAX endopeptidase family protein [Spiroplasma endosymbiont of Notiophilus biguttatus]|uniref:CPBP family intramembrane glutamic endopeptidase n=1 Tax=Spiroplasma endosymbiont of Notiophilus biguttatus TaxID=3066285 RepID=UPI00313EEE72